MTFEWKITLTIVHLPVKPFGTVVNWDLCPYTFNMFKFTGKNTISLKRGGICDCCI